MRITNQSTLLAAAIGILLQSVAGLAGRSTTRISSGTARLSPMFAGKCPSTTKQVPFIATSSASRLRHETQPSTFSRTTVVSPLFSSTAAGIGSFSTGATWKQRLLTFPRGGSGAIAAVTGMAKAFLDDVAASKTKCWMVLIMAILLETAGSTLSKKARDAANPSLFLVSVSLNVLSLAGFCTALGKLDVGIAYAIWAALGTVIVTTYGIVFFHESCDPIKLISILLVIIGVVGLNLKDGSH